MFEPRRITTAGSELVLRHRRLQHAERERDRRASAGLQGNANRACSHETLEPATVDGSRRANRVPAQDEARADGCPVELTAEALDVPANPLTGDPHVEGHKCSRLCETRATDRLLDRRLGPERGRGNSLLAGRSHEHELPGECLSHDVGRLIREEPSDVDMGDADASRNAELARGRRGFRRRSRRWRLCRRGRLGCRGRRLHGTGVRPGRECERRRKPDERTGCEQPDDDRASPRFHVVSVDTNIDGLFVTTASTPAFSTRSRSSGSSTVHVTTAAPRACACRTAAALTSPW